MRAALAPSVCTIGVSCGSSAAATPAGRATTCTTIATASAESTARRTNGSVKMSVTRRSDATHAAPCVATSAMATVSRTTSETDNQPQINHARLLSTYPNASRGTELPRNVAQAICKSGASAGGRGGPAVEYNAAPAAMSSTISLSSGHQSRETDVIRSRPACCVIVVRVPCRTLARYAPPENGGAHLATISRLRGGGV